jgi:hypothetical protein
LIQQGRSGTSKWGCRERQVSSQFLSPAMTCTMMIHAVMRHGKAIKPEHNNCFVAPLEMLSNSCYQSTSKMLANFLGLSIFVLEPKLQKYGVKITKWAPQSYQGVYTMSFLKFDSSLIVLRC